MAADDLQLHGTLKGSSGKNLLMKKKRKIHIHAEKNAHRKKYSTETISLIGLAIVAILNVHLHFNVSIGGQALFSLKKVNENLNGKYCDQFFMRISVKIYHLGNSMLNSSIRNFRHYPFL